MFFYNLVIQVYYLLIKVSSAFNPKAKLWKEGRVDIFKKITTQVQGNTSPIAWFHCASLGEFEQARPVIENFKKEFFDFKILLTFFSPSGYEIRKNYGGADYIFYLPLDTQANANLFIELVNPKIALFVKYEFWYHYVTALSRNKIPIISFSAIFRKDQIFFKWYGSFNRKILSRFTKIFVQNTESIQLLKSINIGTSELAGDTRFDRVKQICSDKKNIPLVAEFKSDKKLFIIGSSWSEDMKVLATLINNSKDLKIIIAPHEISEVNLREIEKTIKLKTIRFSSLSIENAQEANVLLIDNIGMLSSLYQYADLAYIGGAFGKGLHNILEAATFGMPIFFGPNYEKFQEAKDLIQLGGAYSVSDAGYIEKKINELLQDEEKRKTISNISRQYIDNNLGATEKIINFCRSLIKAGQ